MLQTAGSRPRAGRTLDRNGLAALLACVALLLGIGAASVWQASHNEAALLQARAARMRRDRFTNLLAVATDAETAQRGYLLTQDPSYLAPFTAAQERVPRLLAAIKADWPGDARAEVLRQTVQAKFAELAQTVRLTREGDVADALRIVRTNGGSMAMQILRRIVAAYDAELDASVSGLVAQLTRGDQLLVAIDVAGLMMVFALAAVIGLGLRRMIATLQAANDRTSAAYDALEQVNEGLDETVRQRTADLSAANEEVQRFAYIVSHDLRAPLVNIMGFTSELEQAAATLSDFVAAPTTPAAVREVALDEIPEALRFIRTSTAKMDRLINAILRLSREGRRVIAPERLDMASVLQGMVDNLQHQVATKSASVTIGPVPVITADRLAVEQVFGNVIDNALKYLKPGRPGEISLSGRVEDGVAWFDIADNGRGIAARDYERVFELFRRAGDQSVPGEGIGLAHVRALVRRLGGNIECRSTLDVGTTFTICLPVSPMRARELPV